MDTLDFRLDELKSLDAVDPGSFSGWASVYGEQDRQGDVVMPGAFRKTLQERPRVPLLWLHSDPVGSVEPVDQSHGLAVRGKLTLATQKGAEAHALLKSGAVSGLSIGYKVVRHEYSGDARLLREVSLYEISLVAIPALDSARVTQVKQHADGRVHQGTGATYPSRELEEKELELADLLAEQKALGAARLYKVGLTSQIAALRREIEVLAGGAEPVTEEKQQASDVQDRLAALVSKLR